MVSSVTLFCIVYNALSLTDLTSIAQTYPIMALMGLAILLPVSWGAHYLMTSPDVDLLKKRRPFELRRMLRDDDNKTEKK